MDTYNFKLLYITLLSFLFILNVHSKQPLTATIMHQMHRPSGYAASTDKKYIAFSDRKWSKDTGKFSTYLQYFSIDNPSDIKNITEPKVGTSDVSPVFSCAFPNHVFFMRNGQIYYKDFPPTSKAEVQLTNYPIPITDFKIKNNALVFSAKFYFSCTEGDILTCSKKLTDIRNTQNYAVYTQLKMFDWDTWEDENKGNHIFYHKLKLNSDSTITLEGQYPKDLTKGMEINSPPLFNGKEMYDISSDGTMVAFTAHFRGQDEAFSTSWRTYLIKNIDSASQPVPYDVSSGLEGRTANPRFNKDNTKLGFLGMERAFLESDLNRLYVYDLFTNEKQQIPLDKRYEISISNFFWYKDNEIILNSNYYQFDTLFYVKLDGNDTIYKKLEKKGPTDSYSNIVDVVFDSKGNDYMITTKVGYDLPEILIKRGISSGEETVLLDLNNNIKNEYELIQPTEISFKGGDNDTVHGFVFKPVNFQQNKTYPTVLLIHGGPESAWSSGWSFRWNPQLFASHGFAVVMINPHGSIGFGKEFLDRVRNNWGGTPYEDFMKGMDYVEKTFDFIDKDRECAAGGSYGGYSVNWIQGHSQRFKCLINHDGVFSIPQMHYSSDDLFFLKAEMCPQDKKNCHPWESPAIRDGFNKWDPERFVKNWSTPMLVIHGGNDYRVPLTEGLAAFTALQLKNITSKFLYMTKENHWTIKPENSIKWYDEVLGWCDRFIKK